MNAPAASNGDDPPSPTTPSSTVAPTTHRTWHTIVIYLYHITNSTIEIFLPGPMIQDWLILLSTIYTKITNSPTYYRYGAPIFIILALIAEWEQPGFLPRANDIQNYIIGSIPIALFTFCAFAVLDLCETGSWPWNESGWVWPWEAWLWGRTVDDVSCTSDLGEEKFLPTREGHEVHIDELGGQVPTSAAARDLDRHAMPPPPLPSRIRDEIVIPPTPYLPRGLRVPPTPGVKHSSGLLGASPMPHRRFEHFNGEDMLRRQANLRAVAEWSKPGHTALKDIEGYSGLNKVEKDVNEGAIQDGEAGVVGGEDAANPTVEQEKESGPEWVLVDVREGTQ